MENKIIRKTIVLFILCIIITIIADARFNGSFVDWFYYSYMVEYNGSIAPNWTKIKWLFFTLFVIGVPIMYLTISYYVKYRMGKERSVFKEHLLAIMQGKDIPEKHHSEYVEFESAVLKLQLESNRQKELYEKEAMRKNDLITYLAHDLKTPLASVIGYLSFLDEAKDIPIEQKAKFTGIALDKAYRLEMLIDQFFEITRFNLQTIVINREKADLAMMLEQLADEFYPMAQNQHKKISIGEIPSLKIYVDTDKFGRVLNNVLKNAISYSYEDSTIMINAVVEEELLYITFTNRGEQIPKHKLDAIFEKFYRLDSARSTSKGGAGLGLAIAKEIMEAHHGRIDAKSDEHHTTFTITLPLDEVY